MKKVSLVLVSIFSLVAGIFLSACTFKDVEGTFSQEEVVLSREQSINLEDYLQLRELAESEVEFKFSNSSLIELNGNQLTAKKTGTTNIYAVYQNKTLASMKLVVKGNFSKPGDFSVSGNVVSWNIPVEFFGNSTDPIKPTAYLVEGECVIYDNDFETVLERKPISEIVDSNSYQLNYETGKVGRYDLNITAKGTSYFDDSRPATYSTTFGYLVKPASELVWNSATGNLSWSEQAVEEDYKYKVKVDDSILGTFLEFPSVDLSEIFDNAHAGKHKLAVYVYDQSKKLIEISDTIEITKLAAPNVMVYPSGVGGQLEIEKVENAEGYQIWLTGQSPINLTQGEGNIVTTLEGLTSGLYDAFIMAKCSSGNFYSSNKISIGKIYKLPTVNLEGIGDGSRILLRATATPPLADLKFKVVGLGEEKIIDGLSAGSSTIEIDDINLTSSTEISVIALPKFANGMNDGTILLNGEMSNSLTVTKVNDFVGELEHKYQGTNSEIHFEKISNATKYELYYGDGLGTYTKIDLSADLSGEKGKFVLNGRLEDIVPAVDIEGKQTFDLKVVAKTNDDKLAINSAKTKRIKLLGAPNETARSDNSSLTYGWESVDGAEGYKVELYKITKEQFNMPVDQLTLSGAVAVEVVENSYTITDADYEGYYCIKVYALSKDENVAISAKDCLLKTFYVTKQLEISQLSLGETQTAATGLIADVKYFIKIANPQNVTEIEVTVDGNTSKFGLAAGAETTINLDEKFERNDKTYEISVIANAADKTIYLSSEAKTLTLKRLKKVEYADFVFDSQIKNISLEGGEGVRQIFLEDITNGDSVSESSTATMSIDGKTPFVLKATLYGTKKNSGLFENAGIIYLDSEVAELNFERLATVGEINYKNGGLTFAHSASASTQEYILNIETDKLQGGKDNFVIRLAVAGGNLKAVYGGETFENLGIVADYLQISGNNITIKLNKIVEALKNHTTLADFYAQATNLKFEVIAYTKRIDTTPNRMLIASLASTVKEIEKIAQPELVLTETASEFVLSWQGAVTTENATIASDAKYEIYQKLDGEAEYSKLTTITGGTSYAMSKADFDMSKYYRYYIKATHPNYLESSDSNQIAIYLLEAISSLKLTNEGKLEYQLLASQKDFCETVKLSIDGESENELDSNTVAITGDGNYTFKIYGKTVDNGDEKIYYINSNTSTFTLQNMSILKPANENLSYTNYQISYNAFGTGMTNLKYFVYFKDYQDNKNVYSTTELTVDLKNNPDLSAIIESLSAGDIEVKLSAYLESYSVGVGGTIYYSSSATLPSGNAEANHYIYNSSLTISKKTTPNIKKIEFIYDDNVASANYLVDAFNPKIKVTFDGNYVVGDQFSVFINENTEAVLTANITNAGENSFELLYSQINNGFTAGGTLELAIKVVGENAIPSSKGKEQILRALDIKNAELLPDRTLKVTFDTRDLRYLVGGLVLKIEVGGQTLYKKAPITGINELNASAIYDLNSDTFGNIFDNYLAEGGTLKVSAFVNSYSNFGDGHYYLASPTQTVASEKNVLAAVETADITRAEGGFVIDDSVNSQQTIYVVAFGEDKTEVAYQNGQFYYEIPNDWSDNTYRLTIYAKQDGYVNSIESQIEFSLSRIASVEEVQMKRDSSDLSKVLFSWGTKNGNAVSAISGANGYLIRIYKEDSLLCETTKTTNAATMEELFGLGYQKLVDGGLDKSELGSDLPLQIEFITIGNASKNNSYSYSFDCTIKGNSLLELSKIEDGIAVDEFGFISFEAEVGNSYIYRFVTAAGAPLKDWTLIEATSDKVVVDGSQLAIADNTNYEIEVISLGTATTDSASNSNDFEFVFDTAKATTYEKDLTFRIADKIASVGYVLSLPSDLSFEMAGDAFENPESMIYAGLSDNALAEGKVVSFVPNKTDVTANEGRIYYTYSPLELIDLLLEAGNGFVSNSDTTIYFWYFKESESISTSNTISKPTTYTFAYTDDAQFTKIVKMGANDGANENYNGLVFGQDYEDFANTFALFENNDSGILNFTIGIYLKITTLSGEEPESKYSRFIFRDQLLNDKYFDDTVFALNLTEVMEDGALKDLVGRFKIEFSRVEFVGGKFRISEWLTKDDGGVGADLIFERIAPIDQLKISAGDLVWKNLDANTQKYYVYFAEDENLTTNYSFYPTTVNSFNAASYVAELDKYYIAVQALSEDKYVISSVKAFIENEKNEKMEVYKNRVRSDLVLSGGKLSIALSAEDDFCKLLADQEKTDAEIATLLATTTFTSPFTFNLQDLVNGNLNFRLKFTKLGGAEGLSQYFDITAQNLLSNIFDIDFGVIDIKDRFENLYKNAPSVDGIQNLIGKMVEFFEDSTCGIINSSIIFDDLFEKVQQGGYKLEYCLLGTDYTLASQWYNFKNSQTENAIYVNEEPQIKAVKISSPTDKSKNTYKLLIKQSQIYDYDSGEYKKVLANGYVVKLKSETKTHVFEINKGVTDFYLTMSGDDLPRTVSVALANSAGEVAANGEYLMFYLNHNSGDSLLGRFGDDMIKVSYQMQVYAVGNAISTSSKSEVFNLALLGFTENLALVDGTFVWTTQLNRPTSVIVKRESAGEETEVTVAGGGVTSTFALEGIGGGLCNYIKFVMKGEVKGHNIYIDSEVYQVNDVYKLYAPRLSTSLGEIKVNGDENTTALSDSFYIDGENLYKYQIYNDVSTSGKYIKISDEYSSTYYQVGITGIDADNADYSYKVTEEEAQSFSAAALGTSAIKLITTRQSGAENYYKYTITCDSGNVDGGGKPISSDKKISLKSDSATIAAEMLSTPQNLLIEGGLLKWDAVLANDELLIPVEENIKTIYKVTVVQYKESHTGGGDLADTNVGDELVYYTANNYFDFVKIPSDKFTDIGEKTYLKVVVQAAALQYSETALATSVELVEGGYAYGEVNYDGSTSKILQSNGATLSKIDRLPAVSDVKVVNGKLLWKFTVGADITDSEKLFKLYDFEVADENGEIIEGVCEATFDSITGDSSEYRVYNISFVEEKASLSAGAHTLSVYTIQGPENEDLVIKSFAEQIEVEKLETIQQENYVVDSAEEYEVLNLSSYFADGNTNKVYLSLSINGEPIDKGLVFTSERNKLLIYSAEPATAISYQSDFIQDYLVISATDVAKLVFKVTAQTGDDGRTLYSDNSDDIILQRGVLESEIAWNESLQRFEWVYEGYYSFEQAVEVTKMKDGYFLAAQTSLFTDASMQPEFAAGSLPRNTLVELLDDSDDGFTKIRYNEIDYYIAKNSLNKDYVEDEVVSLSAGTLYMVFRDIEGGCLVRTESGEVYFVDQSLVKKPIYVVEAIYGTGESAIKRLYTTTENYFEPTIIGQVTIKVRIKLGEKNLQSQVKEYLGEDVFFDIFASGQGTSASPYLIESVDQFKNISKRMVKGSYLESYVSSGERKEDKDPFHFQIVKEKFTDGLIDLGNFEGVLFAGDFSGVINGGEATISYRATTAKALSSAITVGNDVHYAVPNAKGVYIYTLGAGLFERFSSSAKIDNLKLRVEFMGESGEAVALAQNTLVAPLVIENNGTISNVDLIGFQSTYYINQGSSAVAYAGIATINKGAGAIISNCDIYTALYASSWTTENEIIFLGGISYINYSTISNCNVVTATAFTIDEKSADGATVQAGGIAVANASGAKIEGCIVNCKISVAGTSNTVAYLGGITVLGIGTISGCEYTPGLDGITSSDLAEGNFHRGVNYVAHSN